MTHDDIAAMPWEISALHIKPERTFKGVHTDGYLHDIQRLYQVDCEGQYCVAVVRVWHNEGDRIGLNKQDKFIIPAAWIDGWR